MKRISDEVEKIEAEMGKKSTELEEYEETINQKSIKFQCDSDLSESH